MANFFSKLFGRDKLKAGSPDEAVQSTIEGVLERGGFNLSFTVEKKAEGFLINFSGEDAALVTDREGMLLDSFQIFTKRMLQNKFPDQRVEIEVDCDGFMESSAQDLRDLADKLKAHVLERKAPSYVRALPPRERKVVHRYLAEDARVKSQSVGDGFCKKIKISLARGEANNHRPAQDENFV